MRAELARLHERLGVTTVYVTHDQVEAMTLGERVAVMRDGVLQQVDAPQRLFNHPRNLFVAAFIGSPAMNLVSARLSGGRVHFAGIDLPLPGGSPLASADRDVILGLRPNDFEHAAAADPDWPRIRVTPDVVEQLGSETLLIFGIDAPPVTADAVRAATEAQTDDEGKLFVGEERAMFTASVDAKRPVPRGEIELAVDFTSLHCFDPESGEALTVRRPTHAVA
jgi:multiple sugar transport system ATP-binding protein